MGVLDETSYQTRSSEWSMGMAPRTTGEHLNDTPGPGTYNTDAPTGGPVSCAYSMGGTAPRSTGDALNDTPGPGTYNAPAPTPSVGGSRLLGGKAPRETSDVLNDNPGPGAYGSPLLMGAGEGSKLLGGKAPRVTSEVLNDNPGPGAYGSLTNDMSGKGFSFGASLETGDPWDQTPGPGTYHVSTKPGGAAYSIGGAASRERISQSPGPGAYEASPTSKGAAYSIAMKSKGTVDAMLPNLNGPGPGSYSPFAEVRNTTAPAYSIAGVSRTERAHDDMSPGPATYSPAAAGLVAPAYSMGGYTTRKSIEDANSEPGPGAYDPPISAKGTQAPAFSMGGALRMAGGAAVASAEPGPGYYDSRTEKLMHRGAAYSMSGRPGSAPAKAPSRLPAPGTYSPTDINKYRAAAFSMGQPKTANRAKAVDRTPAPGTYSPTDINKYRAAAFSMGQPKCDARAINPDLSERPGPADYTPTTVALHKSPCFSMGRDPGRGAKPSNSPGPGHCAFSRFCFPLDLSISACALTYASTERLLVSADGSPDRSTVVRSPSWNMKGGPIRRSMATGESTPGPGQYFPVAEGAAYSELTRRGDAMLSTKAKEFAKRNPQSSTAKRF
jgi:hypothetical protein